MKKLLVILTLTLIAKNALSQVVFEQKLSEKIETIKAHSYNIDSIENIKVRADSVPYVERGILPPSFSIKRLYGDFLAKSKGLPASLTKEIIASEVNKKRVSSKGNIFMFKDETGETYVVFLEYQEGKGWLARELQYNTYESKRDPADLKKPAMDLHVSDMRHEDPDQVRPEHGMIVFGKP